MMESLPIYVICKDLMGNIIYANRQFCDLQEISVSEIIGKNDNDLFPSEQAEKYRLDDLEVMKTGQIRQTIEKHQTTSGKQMEILLLKSPLIKPDGTT